MAGRRADRFYLVCWKLNRRGFNFGSTIIPAWKQNGRSNGKKRAVFHASNDSDKPKYYTLIEFPYPSGQGLHVGHPRSYTALDIVARKRRLMGYNVLYPIGWDAFGLPTAKFAIKNHVHPEVVTKKKYRPL